LAGVARAEDRRVRADPARQLVAAHGRDRCACAPADRGRRQIAADRRAAHAAYDETAAVVYARDRRGLDAPERVAHLIRLGQDVPEHAAGIGGSDSFGRKSVPHSTASPGWTRAPGSSATPAPICASEPTTAPCIRTPSPIRARAPTIDSRTTASVPT